MPFWDNIGRALSRIGDWLGQSEERPPEPAPSPFAEPPGEVPDEYENVFNYDRDVPEYEQGQFGLGGGRDEYEPGTFYQSGDGPYPDNWESREMDFWDKVNDESAVYESMEEYEDAQEAFERGLMTSGLSKEDREYWREEWAYMAGMSDFHDWDYFREYWDEISPPG